MVDVKDKLKAKDINIVKNSNKSVIASQDVPEQDKHHDKKCLWKVGGGGPEDVCYGDKHEVEFFQCIVPIKLFVCDAHLEWHMAVMALHRSGMKTDDILDLSKSECLQRAARLLVPIVEM